MAQELIKILQKESIKKLLMQKVKEINSNYRFKYLINVILLQKNTCKALAAGLFTVTDWWSENKRRKLSLPTVVKRS